MDVGVVESLRRRVGGSGGRVRPLTTLVVGKRGPLVRRSSPRKYLFICLLTCFLVYEVRRGVSIPTGSTDVLLPEGPGLLPLESGVPGPGSKQVSRIVTGPSHCPVATGHTRVHGLRTVFKGTTCVDPSHTVYQTTSPPPSPSPPRTTTKGSTRVDGD